MIGIFLSNSTLCSFFILGKDKKNDCVFVVIFIPLQSLGICLEHLIINDLLMAG